MNCEIELGLSLSKECIRLSLYWGYFSYDMWWNYICYDISVIFDIGSTKKKNTIATNVSINYHSKTERDCYILHTVLSAVVLLLIITFNSYYYIKQKRNCCTKNIKTEIINLKMFVLKIARVIISIT